MSHSIIPNPHDRLFRVSMKQTEVAREFLNMYMPDSIKQHLDVESIKFCSGTYIDEQLKLSQSDVLLNVKLANQDAYIYVLTEHQSSPDPLMPFRLWQYMINIWNTHLKQHKKKGGLPLPVIFPLVFYTGDKPYHASLTLWDLCGDNSELMYDILKSPFYLMNVNTLEDSELTSHILAGTLGFVMRSRFRQNIVEEFKRITDNLNELDLQQYHQYVIELMHYIFNIDDAHETVAELVSIVRDKFLPALEKNMMTLADRIEQKGKLEGKLEGMREGKLEGMHEGKIEAVRKMLLRKMELAVIADITELPLEEITAEAKRLQVLPH